MNLNDVERTLPIWRIPTPSSVLVSLPYSRRSPFVDLHSPQPNGRPPSHRIDLQTPHRDTTSPTSGWRRHVDKITRVHAAPDVAYQNTYLHETKREPWDIHTRSPPAAPRHQSSSIYAYIRDSIRQIDQQRNFKRDLSLHIPRPQNEDRILQRALRKRKPSMSVCRSLEVPATSAAHETPTIVNYMQHLRSIPLTASNACRRSKQRI